MTTSPTVSLAHITPIRGVNDDGKGKKYALHCLIHATQTDLLWLHDADTQHPSASDTSLPSASDTEAATAIGDCAILILPLSMQRSADTLIQHLQVIEYTAIQRLTILSAAHGHPILCSGANIVVRRDVWLEAEPFLHPDIPSGDDMFLLEYVKRQHLPIAYSSSPSLTATTYAQPTLRALMRQRMRWAGKAPHYQDHDIRLAGAVVLLCMLLQLLCPPFVLLWLPFEWHLLKGHHFPWWQVVLLAIVYPYYVCASIIGGLCHPHRW